MGRSLKYDIVAVIRIIIRNVLIIMLASINSKERDVDIVA